MKLPENVQKMDMAKAQMAAQPDNIMMLMMLVLPVATQALLPILAEFGFPPVSYTHLTLPTKA